MDKIGIIVNNIGTPATPSTRDVAKYLREFLTDPGVIPAPAFVRYPLVYGLIAPLRSKSSAKKYQKIWTAEGSPLLVHTNAFAEKLQADLGESFLVEVGMRYGSPNLPEALNKLKTAGAKKILLLPLYPQYAEATTVSAVLELRKFTDQFETFPAFFQEPFFLENSARLLQPELAGVDHLLFSFHGLPESQIKKNPGCLEGDCCSVVKHSEKQCYRAQCFASATGIAARVSPPTWSVSFQSRLGPAKWIGPSTAVELQRLAHTGKKRVAVYCPSFVADCLETLEEIQIENRKVFLDEGGESFKFVPCLNSEKQWVRDFSEAIRKACKC